MPPAGAFAEELADARLGLDGLTVYQWRHLVPALDKNGVGVPPFTAMAMAISSRQTPRSQVEC